jgi:hypothetical protein
MPSSYNYHAYGLNIASDLECPELVPGNGAAPDLHVRFGIVPERQDTPDTQNALFQATPQQFLLNIDRVARYEISNGDEIVIDRAPQATDGDIRVFLLGSAIGALLHQRGLLPLHASAIETQLGAVAFMGQVGLGKSTLAAAFHRRGYRVLADDVCAVSLDADGKPLVTPAYPQLNLWADALEQIGETKENLPLTRFMNEKYGRSVSEGYTTQPVPLCAAYELRAQDGGGQPSLARVTGREKMRLLRDNTFRLSFLAGMERDEHYLRLVLATAQQIRAARVSRPQQPFMLDELADLVESDLGV